MLMNWLDIRHEVYVWRFSVLKQLNPETTAVSSLYALYLCKDVENVNQNSFREQKLSTSSTIFLKWKSCEPKLSDRGWQNTLQNTTKMLVCHLGLSGWNRRRYWWHSGLLLSKKAWTYDKWIINSKILGRKHALSFHKRPYFLQKGIYFISLITFIFHSALEKHLLTFRQTFFYIINAAQS